MKWVDAEAVVRDTPADFFFPPPVHRGRARVGVCSMNYRFDGYLHAQPPPQPSPGVPEEGARPLAYIKYPSVKITAAEYQ
jgi:hypothetical protein